MLAYEQTLVTSTAAAVDDKLCSQQCSVPVVVCVQSRRETEMKRSAADNSLAAQFSVASMLWVGGHLQFAVISVSSSSNQSEIGDKLIDDTTRQTIA